MSCARLELMAKTLTLAIPVFNEEVDLPKNLPRLTSFLTNKMAGYEWEIAVVDNASTDRTPRIGADFAKKVQRIKYLRLEKKGRGRALKLAWTKSKSDLLAYMDIDLSSDLTYFPKLIKALEDGADIAIGSRLAPGAKVYGRTFTREIMSRGYSLLFRTLFWTSFRDAQCGFKAMKKEAADKVLKVVRDNGWFFDSELLIVAEKSGMRVEEIPIVWRDDPASTVKVAKTAWGDIKGLFRLLSEKPWKNLKK
ncbi:glycosyltransferase family 2 protein [Candidatus Woesebacteria bacterium]|nr:glycosyltransferase family 2 protein [Candidatus Woesebacteria bacterium]